jgi:hypothetical protein
MKPDGGADLQVRTPLRRAESIESINVKNMKA